MSSPTGCLVPGVCVLCPGGSGPRGVLVPGGCLVPGRMATAAGSTHPTRMHSCSAEFYMFTNRSK